MKSFFVLPRRFLLNLTSASRNWVNNTTSWREWIFRYHHDASHYLANNSKVKSWVQLQISSPNRSGESAWLFWNDWPQAWRNRVDEFYKIFVNGEIPPVPDEPNILTREEKRAKGVLNLDETNIYETHALARDIYFSHVAHVIYLDSNNIVPWKLADYSDNELRYLISSSNIMSMIKLRDGEEVYANYQFEQTDASSSIIGNPIVSFNFLKNEPEEGKSLIGNNQTETIGKLSAWLADYLNHNPGPPYNYQSYLRENPYLTDRLRRQTISINGEEIDVYLSPMGCWSASDLIADLLRSVNIPIKKIKNRIENFSRDRFAVHSGIIYNWQGGGGRYLLHTDSLYTESLNFIPTNPGESPGTQIINQIWLNPSEYGRLFTYLEGEDFFSEASWDNKSKFKSRAEHLLPIMLTLRYIFRNNRGNYIAKAQEEGLTHIEASSNYDRVENILLAHGDGNKEQGLAIIERLYEQWVERTGKIQ